MSNLIRLVEVAELCGIHTTTVSSYVKQNVLPKHCSGNVGNGTNPMLWSKRDILASMKKMKAHQAAKKPKKGQPKNYQDTLNIENNREINGSSFDTAMSLFGVKA